MESTLGIEIIRIAGVLGPLVLMVMGLLLIFARLFRSGDPISENDIQMAGIVIFLPMLPFIAIILPSFPAEALITLLGTVGGYALSSANSRKNQNNNSD